MKVVNSGRRSNSKETIVIFLKYIFSRKLGVYITLGFLMSVFVATCFSVKIKLRTEMINPTTNTYLIAGCILFITIFFVLSIKDLYELIKEKETLHENTMNLAIGLSEYFGVMTNLTLGDVDIKANENTGDDLLNQLSINTNRMVSSQKKLIGAATQIASGKLGTPIEMRSEKDSLGAAFLKMVESLEWLLISLRDTSNQLTTSARELAAAAEQSSSAVEQVAETINQVSGVNTQIAHSANIASESTHKTFNAAKNGEKSITELNGKMDSIKNTVELNSVVMEQLLQQSSRIAKITQTLQEIVAQTHLLSLNATIEAARAGDAGRGFSVVAAEIGNLAENSAIANKEIMNIIKEFEVNIGKAVKVTKASKVEADEGAMLMKDANEKFLSIISEISVIVEQTEQIAAATQEAAASAQEVAASSQEQSASAQEVSVNAQKISEQSEQLKVQLDKYEL